MKICENKRSVIVGPLTQDSHSKTISNILSKAIGLIVTKFVEPPGAEGMKICSNHPGHMTNIATMHGMVKTLKNL